MKRPIQRSTKLEHFKNLVAVAGSDGSFAAIEKEFLANKAIKLGLTQDEVDTIFRNKNSLKISIPENELERKEQIAEIVYIALIDGMLRKVEYQLCLRFAILMGFNQSYLDELIEEVKGIWRSRNRSKTTVLKPDSQEDQED